MIEFLDGPAAGQRLMLKRAPLYLRVTEMLGEWDGLDQIEDEPRREETLYAYRVEGERSQVHILKRGPGSGFYARAYYRFIAQQPADAVMRDQVQWQQWCREQAAAAITNANQPTQ
jgi:hypothetical protein